MNHELIHHVNCIEPHCTQCHGQKMFCAVCGGRVTDLPTDCPGEKLAESVLVRIGEGRLDYINGEWIEK